MISHGPRISLDLTNATHDQKYDFSGFSWPTVATDDEQDNISGKTIIILTFLLDETISDFIK